MNRCPVGENCTGCQYAEHCAHPEVQAERLRADVKQPSRRRRRLTRERDAARFDAAKMAMENDRLRAEVERLKRERDEALDCGATGGEEACCCCIACMRAELGHIRADNARLALRIAHGEAAPVALASARRAALEEAQPDHAFVPGDPACGWERQCAVVVPVTECGRVVGAHCGLPPEAHALWASARDEEAAAIRAAAKEER